MNTPTPTTDTLFNEIEPEFCDLDAWDYFCEMTALAKQMERELTAAQNKIQTLSKIGIDQMDKERTLKSELTAVTEQRDRMAEALYRIANNNVQDTPQTDYAYELGRMEGIAKVSLQSLTNPNHERHTDTEDR